MHRSVAPGILLLLVCTLAPTAPLEAQRIRDVEREVASPADTLPKARTPSAGGAFLASALLPGAGQYRLNAGRWVAYVGLEVWAWLSYVDTRSEARELEAEYRDLAWSVARRIGVGAREDREFEYYEAMSNYAESGAYDADPRTPGVQPEEDEVTFNGTVWSLARAIFYPAGGDTVAPNQQEQEAALAYYRQNAIEPRFAWSWGANQLEHQHFRALIRSSDEAARAGTTILGVILANHVVSAVDALIMARLGSRGRQAPLRLRGESSLGPRGPAAHIRVEIPLF